MALAICVSVPHGSAYALDGLDPLAQAVKDNPFHVVSVFFAAYVLGSIIRCMKVTLAERVSPPFTSSFPYSEDLERVLQGLHDNPAADVDKCFVRRLKAGIECSSLPCSKAAPRAFVLDQMEAIRTEDLFNYWKDTLCIGSERGYEYYESYEARTRFSAGMVLAAAFSALCALYAAQRSGAAACQMAVFSLITYLVFGFHLRRVRRQEARVLLFMYVAHQLDRRRRMTVGGEDSLAQVR
jgi:hypothetical protein